MPLSYVKTIMDLPVSFQKRSGKRRESFVPRSQHRPQRALWKRPLSSHPHFTVGAVEAHERKAFTMVSGHPFKKERKDRHFFLLSTMSQVLYVISESLCYEVVITLTAQKRALGEVKCPAQGGKAGEVGARVDPGFSRAQDFNPIPHSNTLTCLQRVFHRCSLNNTVAACGISLLP